MGTGKNKCLNSNLGLCMCIHEQNRKQHFVMVDPVHAVKEFGKYLISNYRSAQISYPEFCYSMRRNFKFCAEIKTRNFRATGEKICLKMSCHVFYRHVILKPVSFFYI